MTSYNLQKGFNWALQAGGQEFESSQLPRPLLWRCTAVLSDTSAVGEECKGGRAWTMESMHGIEKGMAKKIVFG